MFADHGDAWFQMRTICNPVMLQPNTIKSFIPLVDEISLEFIERIKRIQDSNGEMPSNFKHEIENWGFEAVMPIAIGTRLNAMNSKDNEDSHHLVEVINYLLCFYILMILKINLDI